MRNETEFIVCPSRCAGEYSGLSCGNCQHCELSSKLLATTAWFSRAADLTKKKFLVGLLVRCKNCGILETIRDTLDLTMGKDFTYARSRLKPGLPGDTCYTWSDRALDPKLLSDEVNQTWDWFKRSSDWTRSNYLMGIMSFCDTGLLHILGNLAHVLIVRGKRCSPLRSALGDLEDDAASIPESRYSCGLSENAHAELLVSASSIYVPAAATADLLHCCPPGVDEDVMETATDTGCSSMASASGSKAKESSSLGYGGSKVSMGQGFGFGMSYRNRCGGGTGYGDASDTDSAYCEDPALSVVPQSSRSFSGVCRHRDFVRQLPVHIAKRILGLLDRASLRRCLHVSRHWKYLARETQEEHRAKMKMETQAMAFQKTKSVNPNYAGFQDVPVAVRDDEKFMYHGDSVLRAKKQARVFEAIYSGVITKSVQMEERNVFCGPYNLLLLHARQDPSRMIHYTGGQMVALCSKDRVVRLVDVVTQKEVFPTMVGHTGTVRVVLLCEERNMVISAGYDLSIRCWNIKTGVCTSLLRGHMGTINCLDVRGDRLVSGAKDCKVKVWDLESARCEEHLAFKHHHPVLCVKMDKSFVLSSCVGGLVKMWSFDGNLIKVVSDKCPVTCLYFDDWHIVTGATDGQAMAWSTNPDFKKSLTVYNHPMEVLSLTCLYLRVITGCMDGNIRIFNFLSGECIRVLKACGHSSPLHSVHVSENNIVVDTDDGVTLLQFARGRWDYTSSLEREAKDAAASTSDGSPAAPPVSILKHTNAYVRAQRMAVIGSSNRKLFQHQHRHQHQHQHQQARNATNPLDEAPAEAPVGSGGGNGGGSLTAIPLSHSSRTVSSNSMQHAMEVQQESVRLANWAHVYKRSRDHSELQADVVALSGQDATPPRDKGRETTLMRNELSRGERALLRRVRKRAPVPHQGPPSGPHQGTHQGPHQGPPSLDQMLLSLGSSSQLCPLAEPLRSNTQLNARTVRNAWGSPPHSRSPTEPSRRRPGPGPEPSHEKREANREQRESNNQELNCKPSGPRPERETGPDPTPLLTPPLRTDARPKKSSASSSTSCVSSTPPLAAQQPYFQKIPKPSSYPRSKVIYTPLRQLPPTSSSFSSSSSNASSEPDANVGRRATRSPDERGRQRARSCVPSLERSGVKVKSKGQDLLQRPLRKKRPQTAGPTCTAAGKVPQVTFSPGSPATGDGGASSTPITPVLSPPSLFTRTPADLRQTPVKHVEFTSAKGSPRRLHNPLDPYRDHSGFQLRTQAQLEEYVRTQTERGRRENARGDREERWQSQSRKMTLWGLLARGLPHQHLSQERQVYAPELGPHVYI